MVDLSRLMQDAETLEVIEQSADECRTLSAQNSYQAMMIEELDRELSEARAELETVKRERDALQREVVGWKRMMAEALNTGDGSYRP